MTRRKWLWATSAVGLVLLAVLGALGTPARAATAVFYTDGTTFEAAVGTTVTDDYGSPPYPAGWGIYSDTIFSAYKGETDYHTTGWADTNRHLIDDRYCGGCNGSFELSFQTTSVTQGGTGVYGVGLDVVVNLFSVPYYAFITYGDGTTDDILLPAGASFFGVTATELIKSIHFGLSGGGSRQDGYFAIDNLTIGRQYSYYLPLCVNRAGG